ncbi:hypothetical protein BKI52_19285 [marine bacterium AO1-C]|nr:hypothetical protein BKI52_19285 [marine bacterium AO1-C]
MENQLRKILEDINFIERYNLLVEKYKNKEKLLKNYDYQEVLKLIEGLGYQANYNRKEDFFAIKINVGHLIIQLNISLKYSIVELILAVYEGDTVCEVGGPFAYIARLLNQQRINATPKFDTYETLREILMNAFQIIEDIKTGLLSSHLL